MHISYQNLKKLRAAIVSGLVGATVCNAQVIVPYSPDANTVALYHLDETSGNTAYDSSGNGYNATYGSSVVKGNPSVPGLSTSVQAAANLTTGRISFLDVTETDGRNSDLYTTALGNFTVEAWVRLTDLNFSGYAKIFTVQPAGDANSDYSLQLIGADVGSNDLALSFGTFGNGFNAAFTTGGLSWDVNQMYHVAVTASYNGTNTVIKLYRNIVGDSNTPTSLSPVFGATITGQLKLNSASSAMRQLEIGNFYGAGGNYDFPGYIDEVRLSNIARTEFNLTPVPEPATSAMILMGVFGLCVSLQRKTKALRL